MDIYTELNIDKNRLIRDYITNPLSYFEKPLYNDLKYLYIELNLMRKELMKYFNKGNGTIIRWIHYYNLNKTMEAREQNKIKTFVTKYGTKSYMSSKDFKQKSLETLQEKYHVSNIMKTKEAQEKAKHTLKARTGYDYVFQNPISLSKSCQTNLKRYGVKYPAQSPIIKKKQNTGRTSKAEQLIYKKLVTKFPIIETQYSSSLYPFPCDFYIPELDLYIEYQGYWTHNTTAYNKNNPAHQQLLNIWLQKGWTRAIQTWTISDPMKREIAKKNNLNWVEFFNLKDFEKWFETL